MTELQHKERTVQDIVDGLTPEQRETMDVVIGAAVEDEVIQDDAVIARYRELPAEVIYLIDFIIGGVLAQQEGGELSQDNLKVSAFLEHFGVKGMQWGVRKRDASGGGSSSSSRSASKSQRSASAPLVNAKLSGSTLNTPEGRAAARAKVRTGSATSQEAHVAALKSTGHRVANAFLGDKTYWKGMAITAGVSAGVIGAGLALPMVLPASTLAAIGGGAYFAAGSLVAPSSAVAVQAGQAAIFTAAYTSTAVGAQIASSVLGVTNLVRAVRGNSRIDASYERLGQGLMNAQKNGAKRAAKVLSKDGGINRRKTRDALSQSDLKVDNFLSHYAGTKFEQMQAGA